MPPMKMAKKFSKMQSYLLNKMAISSCTSIDYNKILAVNMLSSRPILSGHMSQLLKYVEGGDSQQFESRPYSYLALTS